MKVQLSLMLTVFVFGLAQGYSSGINIYECDVYSPLFGCDPALWVKGNRKACVNESNIMSWVTKAERSDAFRLWLGEVEGGTLSSYTPDEYITVGVSAMEFDRLHRGILLYAEDSEGNKVGNWQINEELPAVYHQAYQDDENGPCYNTVFHAGASLKAYITRWKVSFPEGTGTVTFRALIKEGDANTGDFWWPNLEGDVSITEGASAEPEEFPWLLTTSGQSCEELCASQEQELFCDPEALESLNSQEVMISEIEPHFACRLPRVGSCSFGPATGSSEGGVCYYHEARDVCTSEERTYVKPSCDAKESDKTLGRSFCKCTDIEPEETDASSGLKVNLFVLFFAFMFAGKMEMKKLFFVLVLLSLLSGVQSHNWINSNSRTVIASTYAPCLPKNSPKPHIQVGKDQEFQIEWMTGHSGRETFLIMIDAKNYDNLTLHSFRLLNDYIAQATVPNMAQDPMWQKLHRRSSPAADYLYQKEVLESDPNYLSRPDQYTQGNSGSRLYAYNASNLLGDVRVEYFNPDYPWIISVSKFVHSIDLPSEYDVARFVIPNTLPEGDYIVQYMWAGYYDCIDINYLPNEYESPSNPVEYPYGYIDDQIETTYTRVDHCYFPEIQTNLYNPIEPWQPVLNGDPVLCLEACRVKSAGCNFVQVVPINHPAGALSRFAEVGGIHQTMEYSRYNSTHDMFYAEDHEYTHICYDLEPRFNSQTQGRYVVTNDPNDPHFYATCYLQNEKRVFIGYEDVQPAKIETPWRFGDFCISCEDHAKITASDYMNPTWVLSDNCVNCDAEPKEKPHIEEIAYAMVRNKSRCDGWQSNTSKPDSFQYPYHKTCSEEVSCYKRLMEWGDYRQTLSACAASVYNDAECSSIFHFYTDPNSAIPNNYRHQCWCYKNLDCCNGCNARYTGTSNYNLYEVYEASTLVGDPRCENGTPSVDFKSCCSSECGQPAACRPGVGTRDVFGFCCSDCIYDRPCSKFQAPCTIDDETAAELLAESLSPEPTAAEAETN